MKKSTKSSTSDLASDGEQMTLFSLEGSRASPIVSQENGLARTTSATFGQKCLEQFGKFNRSGSWAKMFSACLVGMTGWYSKRCNLNWKLKGTKSKRLYFQLVPSMRHIGETEFGLLPTPRTADVEGGKISNAKVENGVFYRENQKGERWGIKLRDVIENNLLPTPTTMDFLPPKSDIAWEKEITVTRPGRSMASNLRDVPFRMPEMLPTPRANKVNGCNLNSESLANRNKGNLEEVIAQCLLPTPCADDNPAKNTGKRNQDSLQKRAFQVTGKTSQLNPRFVAEMMGFPANWTEMPFLKESK